MDTMNYKHELCFGPIAADLWQVNNRKRFLEIWNKVNLFSNTRGINRFKGLYLTFEIMSKEDSSVLPLDEVKNWTNETSELSNPSLERKIKDCDSEELKKALLWSQKVNKMIHELSEKGLDKPYEGVLETLIEIKKYADIAIVSSANEEAINSEWQKHGLLTHVDYVMGQGKGSKQECIEYLIKNEGYSENNIIMLGDSPGDLVAAKNNNVHFYPIMFDDEKSSWELFRNVELQKFLNNTYEDKKYIDKYNDLLNRI